MRLLLLMLSLSGSALADELRLAVVPFDSAGSKEFAELGVGLQSMITTDLAQVKEIMVVERARMADLLAEMKLGTDGVLDPATAARLGEVVGASHVVAGSITVQGHTMRLDVRLAKVASSKIVSSASITGDRDAFFELEKELVKKLIDAVGVELTPKERAMVGKLHTLDFDTFAEFSHGIALYDGDRYAEALKTLQAVSQKDEDFKLARATLGDIEAARDRAADKARAAVITEAETAFVAGQKQAQFEANVLSELMAVAFRGDADPEDRVAAAMSLIPLSGRVSTGGWHKLRATADQFLLKRIGERAYQVVYSLLELPHGAPVFLSTRLPNEERGYDAKDIVEYNRERMFYGSNHNDRIDSCEHVFNFAEDERKMLWVPVVDGLRAEREIYKKAAACEDLSEDALSRRRRDLANKFMGVWELGEAAEILDELTRNTTDAEELKRLASALDRVAARKVIAERYPLSSLEYEHLTMSWWATGRQPDEDDIKGDGALFQLHRRVRGVFDFYRPVFLNGLPAWQLTDRHKSVVTGRRTSGDVATSLRHYGDDRRFGSYTAKLGPPTVFLLGGVRRHRSTTKVKLSYTPPKDWWPLQYGPIDDFKAREERPRAGILVGLQDIKTPPLCDPLDDKKVTSIPARGVGVFVDGSSLVLARMVETRQEPERCHSTVQPIEGWAVEKELARSSIKRPEGELSVVVKDGQVIGKLGRATVRGDGVEAGFVALYAEGVGFVELSEPTFE